MDPVGSGWQLLKQVDAWYLRRVAGRRDIDVRVHLGHRLAPEVVAHDGDEPDTSTRVPSYVVNVRNTSPRRRALIVGCWVATDPPVALDAVPPRWLEPDGDQWETWVPAAQLPTGLDLADVAPLVRVKLGNDDVLEGTVRTDEVPPEEPRPQPDVPVPPGTKPPPLPAQDTLGDSPEAPGDVWRLPDRQLTGSWQEIDRKTGVEYRWPDGNVDRYRSFDTYRGTGDFDGMTLALGHLDNGDVAGFAIQGTWQRAIVYFFPADDFATSGEKLSLIKGGGARGRSGFGPTDPVPVAYQGAQTQLLRSRIEGKWNVLAIVARADDPHTMLLHTAIQARLRSLG